MATTCAEESVKFLHVSTDYVFDGVQTGSYTGGDEPNPIQEYGASNLAGEQNVRGVDSGTLVTRLSFVYGIHRSSEGLTGFPARVRGRLTEKEETPLFTVPAYHPYSGRTGRRDVSRANQKGTVRHVPRRRSILRDAVLIWCRNL